MSFTIKGPFVLDLVNGRLGIGKTPSDSFEVAKAADGSSGFLVQSDGQTFVENFLQSHLATTTASPINSAAGYFYVEANHTSGTIPEFFGFEGDMFLLNSGNVTSAYGVAAAIRNNGSGTITNGIGVHVYSAQNTGGGTITYNIGVQIDSQSGFGVNNYAIVYGAPSAPTWAINDNGKELVSYTDTSGSPGNATANTVSGRSAIATSASSITITNSLATANSIIHVTYEGASEDATLTRLRVSSRSGGSFVVSGNTTATAPVVFSWSIKN